VVDGIGDLLVEDKGDRCGWDGHDFFRAGLRMKG
jgi:hypothetical protein